MGSASSVECCQPQVSAQEFSSIVPSRIHAVTVVDENYHTGKDAVCATSFLSEIDFYIAKLKEDQIYRKQFMQIYPTFEDLLDAITYELTPSWVVPIQSKTYDLSLIRFNSLSGTAFPLEFGLVDQNVGNADAIFSRGNLRKASLLLLDRDFKSYKEEEYLQLLTGSLRQWKGMQDFVWILDAQTNFADMRRHLLYHWNRCIGFINSDLSINDALSLSRARFLYNFSLHVLAKQPLYMLEGTYSIDNWVYEAEAALLATGQAVTFFGFVQLSPYIEEKADYEDDTVRFSPPKGEEQLPKIKIKFIVMPLKEAGNKFRRNETLYYLPLTTFLISNIEQKYGQIFVYLKEQTIQAITNYLSTKTRNEPPLIKARRDAQKKLINELSAFRQGFVEEIEQKEESIKLEKCCIEYYNKYVKGRVARLVVQRELPILSKKQLQVCEDDVKIAFEEQPTHEEVESEVRWVPVTPQETVVLQRDLQRYIKHLQFEKLQSQIDNVDMFINITSLNISQCWLEKLECLHCFPNLTELFAYSNLIKKIEGLEKNENLRLLSLARNQIQVLENINHLSHLRELYLTKNRLELSSAAYLSGLNMNKLKLLTISFKVQADECFDALLRRPFPRLKQLVINEGDQLAQRTKNTLKRRLKGVDIQFIHD